MNPYMMTLTEASDAIKRNELSPTELTESILERIRETEPVINAWVTIDPEKVLKDTANIVITEPWSRLYGIPIGIKDIYFTEGIKTTMGSPIYQNHVPKIDADVVKKIKEKGGILLGKTETTEFALHDPAPTRNPWNINHTPGGSSSGSAETNLTAAGSSSSVSTRWSDETQPAVTPSQTLL